MTELEFCALKDDKMASIRKVLLSIEFPLVCKEIIVRIFKSFVQKKLLLFIHNKLYTLTYKNIYTYVY